MIHRRAPGSESSDPVNFKPPSPGPGRSRLFKSGPRLPGARPPRRARVAGAARPLARRSRAALLLRVGADRRAVTVPGRTGPSDDDRADSATGSRACGLGVDDQASWAVGDARHGRGSRSDSEDTEPRPDRRPAAIIWNRDRLY